MLTMSKDKANKITMLGRYNLAKVRDIGQDIICPSCGNVHTKKTKQHVFCSNGKTKGKGNCKDAYWNVIDENKRNRKHSKSHYRKYNVGHKSYEVRFDCDLNDNDCVYDSFHPLEGLNDDEYKNF